MDGDEMSGWKPGKPTPFWRVPSTRPAAAFSPDGRWLAYQSDESGGNEVYVARFQGRAGDGRSRRREDRAALVTQWQGIVLLAGDRGIMVATYTTQGDTFRADKPHLWAKGTFTGFDLHPTGSESPS